MTATYTFDVFCTVDGFASYGEGGDWGGYWGKHGPEFLDRRLALYAERQRMVLGANTFRQFVQDHGPEHGELKDARPGERPDEEHADDGGVNDARRVSLDWPDVARCERRRRRHRFARLKEAGVRRAVALARPLSHEPGD